MVLSKTTALANVDISKVDISKKVGGVVGLIMALGQLPSVIGAAEFRVFCECTPDGAALWEAFKAKRDAPDAPGGYNFIDFANAVVLKARHIR